MTVGDVLHLHLRQEDATILMGEMGDEGTILALDHLLDTRGGDLFLMTKKAKE